MKMKKTYFSLLTVLILICALALGVSAEASVGAYMTGYPDGTFLPDNNMTRAEAVTLIYRLIDEQEKNGEYSCTFTDVNKDDWYYEYVAYFDALGYLDIFKGEFAANVNITRAEFVSLILELFDVGDFMTKYFSDVPDTSEYFIAISKAASAGLVSGYPDGTFRPDGNITRAEAVTIVNRYLNRQSPEKVDVTFSDIDGHWAYDGIIRSANRAVNLGRQSIGTVSVVGAYADRINYLLDNSLTIGVNDYLSTINDIAEDRKKEIISLKTDYTNAENVRYISNNGNDANDGLTPETAWATLDRIKDLSGTTVLFECGGIWRGSITASTGMTYASYGVGARPKIYGSARNYADPEFWEETEVENVYKLKENLTNAGIIVFDYSGDELDSDALISPRKSVKSIPISELDRDRQFISDKNGLYLYSSAGNPGSVYSDIEIGDNNVIFNVPQQARNVTIDGLCVMFTGSHAISSTNCYHLTVKNCVIGYVGGSNLGTNTQYGNCVQVYGGAMGMYITDNYIFQAYDTGVTLQQFENGNKDVCKQDDVKITGNVIDKCFWAIEMRNLIHNTSGRSRCIDTDISYNCVINNGYGWSRYTGESLMEYIVTDNVENYNVHHNIFCLSFRGKLVRNFYEGAKKIRYTNNIFVAGKSTSAGEVTDKYERNYLFIPENYSLLKSLGIFENSVIVFMEHSDDMKNESAN